MTTQTLSRRGIHVALIILFAWSTLFFFSLFVANPLTDSIFSTVALQYLVSFSFIGLFITAHDSMHGTVSPDSPHLNKMLGSLCAGLYGAFTLKQLSDPHHRHHAHPASLEDPDYDGKLGNTSALMWWLKFMWRYFTLKQLLILSAAANIFIHVLGVSDLNVLFFWIIPSLWSSFQLFYFGTYLPHRTRVGAPFKDHHNSRSQRWSRTLSFLSCYHFGYHWEHHRFPHLPWWKLPSAITLTDQSNGN